MRSDGPVTIIHPLGELPKYVDEAPPSRSLVETRGSPIQEVKSRINAVRLRGTVIGLSECDQKIVYSELGSVTG